MARRLSFIERLAPPAREHLMSLGSVSSMDRGEYLMHIGEPGRVVVLVISGMTKVVGQDFQGAEVILDFGVPGDLLGEAAVITGEGRMASVVAMDMVEVRQIAAVPFESFLTKHPDATMAAFRISLERQATAQQVRMVSREIDPVTKVAARLEYLLDICGIRTAAGWQVPAPLDRETLAMFVPIGRTRLFQSLTALQNLGALHRDGRTVIITDRDRLRSIGVV